MKLKTIQAIMKQSRLIQLINADTGEQWITDGYAAYPLRGLPEMKLANLQSFFDMTDKQWDKVSAKFGNIGVCLDDTDDTEKDTEYSPVTITYYGTTFKPIMCGNICYYVQSKYLKPFSEDALYTIRTDTAGKPCIAVREGFFLCGIIMPIGQTESFVKDVKTMIETTQPVQEAESKEDEE